MSLYIAGLKGMVGSVIAMEAEAQGLQVLGRGSHELDLLDRLTLIEELLASKLDSRIRFGQNI
jgi:nucleoside-diphosphate-sugar epimerase